MCHHLILSKYYVISSAFTDVWPAEALLAENLVLGLPLHLELIDAEGKLIGFRPVLD